MAIQAVKGMKDVLPKDAPRWQRLEQTFASTVSRYGFSEVRPPVVEPTELFVRSIGEHTDIVEKEMYTFTDRGDKSLTLRPEGTASCVRAYIQHSVSGKEPVSKWYYLGPMYRRERPAKGRYRQFYQGGVEVFGDAGPYVDAEVIDMVVSFLGALGIDNVEVLVNSLGDGDSRSDYTDALVAYLTPQKDKLCDDCRRRLSTNPLRVLDCKVPSCKEIAAQAPLILDHLSAEDRTHFEGLTATLDKLGTPYRIDGRLVRGLDYYTRTLFEVRDLSGELGAQNALLGGGRYDAMVKELGGPNTPAFGFAMGLERLLMAMPEQAEREGLDAFVVAAQPEVRADAALLATELRKAGLTIESDLRGNSLKSQMRRADKMGAPIVLILGHDELAEGQVQLKDLNNKTQKSIPRDAVVEAITERI